MIFLRIALIALVVWIALRLTRRVLEGRRRDEPAQGSHRGKMVRCEVCGVYLPESDAVTDATGRASCGRH